MKFMGPQFPRQKKIHGGLRLYCFWRFPTLSTAGMFDFSEKDPPKQYPVSGHHPLVGEFKIRFPCFSYELPGASSCIGMNPGSRIVMADQGEVAHVAVKWDIS